MVRFLGKPKVCLTAVTLLIMTLAFEYKYVGRMLSGFGTSNANNIEYQVQLSLVETQIRSVTKRLENQEKETTAAKQQLRNVTARLEQHEALLLKQQLMPVPASSINNNNRQLELCQQVTLLAKKKRGMGEFLQLCAGGFFQSADHLLEAGKDLNIVQIGAHVGFESNDPIHESAGLYLERLTPVEKQRVHWTFVEPSPPNYKRLAGNLKLHASLCDLQSVNAAVVSDATENTEGMMFYSLSEKIDPETGYDSKSGKQLPSWITQVSSFSKKPIMHNEPVFSKRGLNVDDYIVETPVTTLRYSQLMKDRIGGAPLFLLIDTEGFDCDIILGISEESTYWPKYLIFEDHQCGAAKLEEANTYLERMGYTVKKIRNSQNSVAIQKELLL